MSAPTTLMLFLTMEILSLITLAIVAGSDGWM